MPQSLGSHVCSSLHLAGQATAARSWGQLGVHQGELWTMHGHHTMQLYTALARKGILTCAAVWVSPGDMIQVTSARCEVPGVADSEKKQGSGQQGLGG